jgi:hypothetical protein
MRSLALKLLALLAYMAMPFTMSVAMSAPMPAAAHHESMMAMEGMGHGPEHSAPDIDRTAFLGCAMMCAALPGFAESEPQPLLFPETKPVASPVQSYADIDLEIATPPPRRA